MQAPWFMNLQLTSHPKICSLFCVAESSSSCGFGNKELTADLQSPGGQRANSKKIPTESIREAPCFGRYVFSTSCWSWNDGTRYDKTPIKWRREDFLGAVFKDFVSTFHLYLEVPHAEARTHTHTFIYFVDIFIYTLTNPCIHRPSCE